MSTKQMCVACRENMVQEHTDLCSGCEDAYWDGQVDKIKEKRRKNGLDYQ